MLSTRPAKLAVGLAVLSALPLAITDPARSQQHQTGTLSAHPASQAPLLDGLADDPAWDTAEPLVAQAMGMGAGGVMQPGQHMKSIALKAVHNDAHLYLLAQWEDDSPSIDKNVWTLGESGWARAEDEDRLAFLWEISGAEIDDFDLLGCAAACHGGDRMRAPGPGQRADQWQWKAARTNPMVHADDQYLDDAFDAEDDEAAHHGDGGDSSYSSNDENDAPRWAWDSDSPSTPPGVPESWATRFLLLDEAVPIGADNPLTGQPWAEGDRLPGYALRMPTGSRGDIEARGRWFEGRWTVELRRRLDTRAHAVQEDVTVDTRFELGGQTRFGIAVWDNAHGIEHLHAPGPYTLSIEPETQPEVTPSPEPVEPSATPGTQPPPEHALWLPLLLGDAAPIDAEPQQGCPIDADSRDLIEEILFESARDAAWSAGESGHRQRGFALSLPGVDAQYTGAATLVEECSAPTTYDHYCEGGGDGEEPGFWDGRSKCLRLGCLAEGIGFADVYMTEQPREMPADRHAFAYASSAPTGVITFTQNPLLRWQYDLRRSELGVVTGTLDHALRYRGATGPTTDLSHHGVVTVTMPGGTPSGLGLAIEFPSLAERPAQVRMHMVDGHLDAGTIELGEEAIATIEGRFSFAEPPEVRWIPACTDG